MTKHHFDHLNLNVHNNRINGFHYAEFETKNGAGLFIFESEKRILDYGIAHNEAMQKIQARAKNEQVILRIQLEPGAKHSEILTKEADVSGIIDEMNTINRKRNSAYHRSQLFKKLGI